jgi:hypothetical protein
MSTTLFIPPVRSRTVTTYAVFERARSTTNADTAKAAVLVLNLSADAIVRDLQGAFDRTPAERVGIVCDAAKLAHTRFLASGN